MSDNEASIGGGAPSPFSTTAYAKVLLAGKA